MLEHFKSSQSFFLLSQMNPIHFEAIKMLFCYVQNFKRHNTHTHTHSVFISPYHLQMVLSIQLSCNMIVKCFVDDDKPREIG